MRPMGTFTDGWMYFWSVFGTDSSWIFLLGFAVAFIVWDISTDIMLALLKLAWEAIS